MSGARWAPLALALAAGCAHARTVPAEVIRAGAHCGGDVQGTSARWLGTEQALRGALQTGAALGAPSQPPAVDFSREGVLLVAAGQRPTAGYGLALAEPGARVEDGVATVVVRFDEPASGAILAQVVTSPCLLVRLPGEGLREVRVVDPAGAVRATARVN